VCGPGLFCSEAVCGSEGLALGGEDRPCKDYPGTIEDWFRMLNARLRYTVAAGTTYRILANSYGEDRATGTYRLSVRFAR